MKKTNHVAWSCDKWILLNTLAILFVGLLMVSSASMVISDRRFGFPFYYLLRQGVYVAAGLVCAWLMTGVPIRLWQRYSGYLMLAGLVLLVLVLIPGIGNVVNGSRRWIHVGFISLQVTELVKVFTIIYVADFLVRHQERIRRHFLGAFNLIVLLGVMALLLLLEPDFGTFVVITFTLMTLLFLAGVRLGPFIILLVLASIALAGLAIMAPYRLERLTTFLNPWADQYGAGYQLTQSLIAFGRGGIFGVGLGNSVQKLFYLPEAHTDFIFAVISEELGFIGALLIIALYVSLITRIFIVGQRAKRNGQPYSAYLAFGIGLWIGFQALVNMGVSTGVLPTKGLTLPFISYGGSSVMVTCVAIAFVMRVAYETEFHDERLPPSSRRNRNILQGRKKA